MNKATIRVNGPQLGSSQLNLEAATKELRASQKAFKVAQQRLTQAEEGYLNAKATVSADYAAVMANTKVIPLSSQ